MKCRRHAGNGVSDRHEARKSLLRMPGIRLRMGRRQAGWPNARRLDKDAAHEVSVHRRHIGRAPASSGISACGQLETRPVVWPLWAGERADALRLW